MEAPTARSPYVLTLDELVALSVGIRRSGGLAGFRWLFDPRYAHRQVPRVSGQPPGDLHDAAAECFDRPAIMIEVDICVDTSRILPVWLHNDGKTFKRNTDVLLKEREAHEETTAFSDFRCS